MVAVAAVEREVEGTQGMEAGGRVVEVAWVVVMGKAVVVMGWDKLVGKVATVRRHTTSSLSSPGSVSHPEKCTPAERGTVPSGREEISVRAKWRVRFLLPHPV